MVEPISIGLSSVISTAVSKLMEDVYEHLKDKVAIKIQKNQLEKKLPTLLNTLNNVRMVKTLWQIDHAVDVESFYCPLSIIRKKTAKEKAEDKGRRVKKGEDGNEIRIKIDKDDNLNIKNNIVIQGTAGQGKSILLRHLFIKEFETGKRIPIFIELRRIQADDSLLSHFNSFIDILGYPIDRDLFTFLIKTGKFGFFLDGFDEIPDNLQQRILNELEYLAAASPETQFIVTSRPNSGIEMSSIFKIVTLDNLMGTEYEAIIYKLSDSTDYANSLVKRIQAHESNIGQLLLTPLLVTLLILSYKSYQVIPEQLADFYETIFELLLRRHDGTKPGYTRQRSCKLNDHQYRQVFDAFCFESKRLEDTEFNSQQIYYLIEKAINSLGLKEDPEKYIADIKNITCLIIEEGEKYSFIHRSVQEYYSASFIKNRSDNVAKSFYEACYKTEISNRWHQVLSFLFEIDKYRHHKYYLIPVCKKWMGLENDDSLVIPPDTISIERAKKILGEFTISFNPVKIKQRSIYLNGINQITPGINRNIILDYYFQKLKK